MRRWDGTAQARATRPGAAMRVKFRSAQRRGAGGLVRRSRQCVGEETPFLAAKRKATLCVARHRTEIEPNPNTIRGRSRCVCGLSGLRPGPVRERFSSLEIRCVFSSVPGDCSGSFLNYGMRNSPSGNGGAVGQSEQRHWHSAIQKAKNHSLSGVSRVQDIHRNREFHCTIHTQPKIG